MKEQGEGINGMNVASQVSSAQVPQVPWNLWHNRGAAIPLTPLQWGADV